MKVFYDDEVDALYLKLGEGEAEGVAELQQGIHLDVSREGKVIGIEILDASQKIDLHSILSYSLEFDRGFPMFESHRG